MIKTLRTVFPILVIAGFAIAVFMDNRPIARAPVTITPDWATIALWPGLESPTATAEPDAARETTILVFDDSGSMSDEINDAKAAVLGLAARLPETTHLGAVALNKGVLIEPMPAKEAVIELEQALQRVYADGSTPLTEAVAAAYEMIRQAAADQRGFGNYRIIVTTDGAANDEDTLLAEVTNILSNSPVQIATIGLGIGRGHPLNLEDETQYIAIDSVAEMAGALETVSAEQTTFDPITQFEETN